ncbi:MAG TPA: HAD-IA family hydrolase [Candidatus Deferrimicrobium sp.]|nr:HAD-IA family hydrolase [Candidatus Deferrimicrobium sp.]
MPVFDLYLFDLDGTLVDTRRDIAQAVNHVLQLHARPVADLTTVVSWVGDGLDDMMMRAFQTDERAFVGELVDEFRSYYMDHCTDFSYVYEGCAETLTSLQERGTHLSVLTNKPQDLSLEILRHLGILQFFDRVVGPSDANLRKPNPSNLVSLVRDIGTSKERTLMVGDSRNDILVARNAGVASCGCTFGYIGRDALLELKPTFLIETWPELLLLADPAN